eukprot:2138921-Amphidinium_carterae.1
MGRSKRTKDPVRIWQAPVVRSAPPGTIVPLAKGWKRNQAQMLHKNSPQSPKLHAERSTASPR